MTSEGIKKAEGLAADIYMDKAVQAYTAGDEILCIIGEDTEECRLENVWIEFGENDSLRVFFDGYERQIKLEGRLSPDAGTEYGGSDICRWKAHRDRL